MNDAIELQGITKSFGSFVAVDDLSPAEVAGEMGMTGDAVRQAKSRVIRRLKAEFGERID